MSLFTSKIVEASLNIRIFTTLKGHFIAYPIGRWWKWMAITSTELRARTDEIHPRKIGTSMKAPPKNKIFWPPLQNRKMDLGGSIFFGILHQPCHAEWFYINIISTLGWTFHPKSFGFLRESRLRLCFGLRLRFSLGDFVDIKNGRQENSRYTSLYNHFIYKEQHNMYVYIYIIELQTYICRYVHMHIQTACREYNMLLYTFTYFY